MELIRYLLSVAFMVVLCMSGTAQKKVLVYTHNGEGYVHDNIAASVEMIYQLGSQNGFDVVHSDDPSVMTEDNLKNYDLLIFSNSNNEAFDSDAQKLAFQRYIIAGGGFIGIHSASGSEREWPWFWSVVGGKFRRHPPHQEFSIDVVDRAHPSASHLGDRWDWKDECYYLDHLDPGNLVVLAADLTTVEDSQKEEYPGKVFGDHFPLAWYKERYGGRHFYTALGHSIEYYSDPLFVKHVLGGINWVLDNPGSKDYTKAPVELIMKK